MKNLTLYLLFVLCASCSKDDDMGNQEVVRCKVNGEDWEAYSYTAGGPFGQGTGSTDLQYYADTKTITLIGVRKLEDQSVNQSINISSRPVDIGDNKIFLVKREFKDWLNESGCIYYDLDTLNENVITILEINSEERKIEGTFYFSAINDCSDTVRITDGYFNLQYRF